MESTHCLNCEAPLTAGQKFCTNCGQKAATHRITLSHFFHEVFHAFTHADKGILHLVRGLATHPGIVAREYIDGKRKKYFNPFTFYFLVLSLFILAFTVFSPVKSIPSPDPAVLAQLPTEKAKQAYTGLIHRAGNAQYFLKKYGNVFTMLAVPFAALMTWLFFRRKKYNYAEHLTANMLFATISNILYTVLIMPLMALFNRTGNEFIAHKVMLIGTLIIVLYLTWALNGFLALRTPGQRTKSFLVSLFTNLLWIFITSSASGIYILQTLNPQTLFAIFLKFLGL